MWCVRHTINFGKWWAQTGALSVLNATATPPSGDIIPGPICCQAWPGWLQPSQERQRPPGRWTDWRNDGYDTTGHTTRRRILAIISHWRSPPDTSVTRSYSLGENRARGLWAKKWMSFARRLRVGTAATRRALKSKPPCSLTCSAATG